MVMSSVLWFVFMFWWLGLAACEQEELVKMMCISKLRDE